MDFEDCLKTMAREGGSDLYLTTGAPPSAKFNGELRPLSSTVLPPGRTKELARQLMDDQRRPVVGELRLESGVQFNQKVVHDAF